MSLQIRQVPRLSSSSSATEPLPPPHMFHNFTFSILPSDSLLALWIQSSRIYEKPLNALQFWRRGAERDYFFIPLILSTVFIFVGTHPLRLISLRLRFFYGSSKGINDTREA